MVLPEPRKPVTIVIGIAGAMVLWFFFSLSLLLFFFSIFFSFSERREGGRLRLKNRE